MCKLENVESDRKKEKGGKGEEKKEETTMKSGLVPSSIKIDQNQWRYGVGYSRVAFHRDLINCQSLATARSLSRQILYGAKLRENRVHGLARPKWYFISIRRWYFSMSVHLYRDTVIGDSIFGRVLALISFCLSVVLD